MKKISLKIAIIEYVLVSLFLHLLSGTLISLAITLDSDIIILFLGYVIPFFITKIVIEISIGKKIIMADNINDVKIKLKQWNIVTFIFLIIGIATNNILLLPSYIINGIIANAMLKKKIDKNFEDNDIIKKSCVMENREANIE